MKNRIRELRAERGWSQAALAERLDVLRQTVNAIAKKVENLVSGAADLYPSTDVYIKEGGALSGDNFMARNIHYGIREHGMGAVLQGIALHRGVLAFGSTFLANSANFFASPALPSWRYMAAKLP